ncbi:CDP-diacylglycerol--serine O-phosphatidyltransferase [Litorisediminicola beolgyonensis]|uniref:CDP-diacylglycerol--serine O-phosphatidyltransferase n=1 Tax=Litorisediminicola beolgyonensis TaxID=1173614 RepID=A0ABW3ZD12_9RHOB
MSEEERKSDKLTLVQLIPNMMTLTAICAGLTAIRFGLDMRYELAVQMILLAAILDGLDGRIARALGSDSKMGAELDSLADFLNFGVAPALILYTWALEDTRGIGWLAVLVYAVCCVSRLARFNVERKSGEEGKGGESAYFTGVPSPAGALLVMLPMYASFAFADAPILPDLALSAWMAAIGYLMISKIPTWSFKTLKVSRGDVRLFFVGFVVVGAALLSFAWTSLVGLCIAYVVIVVWKLATRARI